jgi:uncharacterized protein with NAD-binding domain and iron-sulfur cluster
VTTKSEQSVLIFGASLAGLTAAFNLRQLGYGVTILDHQSWQNDFLLRPPNVPTYLLGCHQATLNLLRALDANRSSHTDNTVPLEFRLPDARIAAYRRSRLPSPLHWIVSLLRFEGLTRNDRWNLFSYLERVWEQALAIPSDLENRVANEWLTSIGQSQNAREEIWQPLAHWLTGNPLGRLSAATFVQTLSKLFLVQPSATRITQLKGDFVFFEDGFLDIGLLDRLTNPLGSALLASDANIWSFSERDQLLFDQERVAGVRLSDGRTIQADWYIAALPRQTLLSLLPERLLTRLAYFSQIGELTDLAGVTVQLTCQHSMKAPRLVLLSGRSFSQLSLTPFGPLFVIVHLSAINNPSLYALSDVELMDVGRTELRLLCQDIPGDAIQSIKVYREEHAALSLQPGAAMLRPIQKSPIPNLLVAGAWTDTGWPPNAESAIVSANRCAEIIAQPVP